MMKKNSGQLRKLLYLVCFLICISNVSAEKRGGIVPQRLTCEYLVNPSVVDKEQPRLSWINEYVNQNGRGQKQTAWQVQVATSKENLQKNVADLWNSEKQKSSQSTFIQYAGTSLSSGQECWWRVRVWDNKGIASQWSEPACWTMGLLKPSDWKAQWIGAPWQNEKAREDEEGALVYPAPLLRKDFKVNKSIASAKAFVSGLGFFELYLNGVKVGDDVLVPNLTLYGKREGLDKKGIAIDDNFKNYRVMYLCYDVTSMLQDGDNTVGCILGNGFYNPIANWTKAYGSPRFIGQIQITYTDGTQDVIVSDNSWMAHRSAILVDGIYDGEIYDARNEISDWATPQCNTKEWEKVAIRKEPGGRLVAQTALPDRVMEQLKPVYIQKNLDGSYDVDFGQEISGWLKMDKINGEKGTTIEIQYVSESPNGTNKYILNGTENESYAPRFTWFVFRKVKLLNWPGDLTPEQLIAEAVYTNVETTGHFECSNSLFNQINQIWWRSQTDNMHGGIASDCPHRERSPYTGDGQVSCVTVMQNFDAAAFYTKWIQDMLETQNKETGYVPNAAPWQPGCGGGVAWGAALNIMPYEFYVHYGDKEMLERNYEGMKEQLNYMLTWLTPDSTMFAKAPRGKEPLYWLNLGDWCPPYGLPSDELVHTFYLWRCADYTAKTAQVLNNKADQNQFMQLAESIKNAFHNKFYNKETHSYGEFGSNIFALAMGVPDEYEKEVVNSLKEEILKNGGHLNTGIFGTQYFFETLAAYGLTELAYTAMNKRDFPSFGHWIEQGATTTWEQWDGQNSRNHPMFGGALSWFYRSVAGLRTEEADGAGYKQIVVAPVLADSLTFASYSTRTPYGNAAVAWKKDDQNFQMDVTIPVGSLATVRIPAQKDALLLENGEAIKKAKGVDECDYREGYFYLKVKSGRYHFEVQ